MSTLKDKGERKWKRETGNACSLDSSVIQMKGWTELSAAAGFKICPYCLNNSRSVSLEFSWELVGNYFIFIFLVFLFSTTQKTANPPTSKQKILQAMSSVKFLASFLSVYWEISESSCCILQMKSKHNNNLVIHNWITGISKSWRKEKMKKTIFILIDQILFSDIKIKLFTF